MSARPLTTMAFAAHHNRIGFCYLIGKQPMDWQLAHKAAKTPEASREKVAAWIAYYQPDIVITEDLAGSQRKGRKAQQLIIAIKDAALATDVQHIEIARLQPFANKYAQIDHLCELFPQMMAAAPKKRLFFEAEPPYITIFEALAMAQSVHE